MNLTKEQLDIIRDQANESRTPEGKMLKMLLRDMDELRERAEQTAKDLAGQINEKWAAQNKLKAAEERVERAEASLRTFQALHEAQGKNFDEALDERDTLLAQKERAENLNLRWNKAASHQFAGSEYLDDPERVFAAARRVSEAHRESFVRAVKNRKLAEEQLEAERKLADRLA